jgi:hypothetical protein
MLGRSKVTGWVRAILVLTRNLLILVLVKTLELLYRRRSSNLYWSEVAHITNELTLMLPQILLVASLDSDII